MAPPDADPADAAPSVDLGDTPVVDGGEAPDAAPMADAVSGGDATSMEDAAATDAADEADPEAPPG